MASTGVDLAASEKYKRNQQIATDPEKPTYDGEGRRASVTPSMKGVYDSTHRKLKPRHIQLIGIGGTIGTALYVQIGKSLLNGGPASLFLAFSIW